METPFPVVAIGSPLHDARSLAALTGQYATALARAGAALAPSPAPGNEPLAVFVATGGTERAILDLAASRPGAPVCLIAHPRHNSLAASLESLAGLSGSRPGRVLFLSSPDDAAGLDALRHDLEDLRAWAAMRRTRLGLLGGPSEWLVASSPSPAAVAPAWGPQVIELPMDRLLGLLPGADRAEASRLAGEIEARAAGRDEPDRPATEAAARLHLALSRLVREERLDAVTLRCFDLLTSARTTGCLSLALLNDEGIPAACEGDLPSAVAMTWARKLLGAAAWMANPVHVDERGGALGLAHCTVPPSLLRRFRLRSHFESGTGVALGGELIDGEVTLVRVGGPDLRRAWIAEGTLTGCAGEEGLCRTQAEVRLPPERAGELLRSPLGNHLVVVPGRHARRLERYFGWLVGGAPGRS